MAEFDTSEELRKLSRLSTGELLKEFVSVRERFRDFLKNSGIDISEVSEQEKNTQEDMKQDSVLLDEFSAETIAAIDGSVTTVYGNAGAFLVLFEKIPESTILKHVTLTVNKSSLTASELHEKVKSGEIKKDEQITIIYSELRALLPDLTGKPLPEEEETGEEPAPDAGREVAEVQEETEEEEEETGDPRSPFITQAKYDKLMSKLSFEQEQLSAEDDKAEEEQKEQASGEEDEVLEITSETVQEKEEEPEPKEVEEKKDEKKKTPSPEDSLSQKELEELMSDTEKKDTHNMSQEELDAYLAGEPETGKENHPSPEELDKLLPKDKKDSEEDNKALSQEELDKLFGNTRDQAAEPVKEKPKADTSEVLSQADLDALFESVEVEDKKSDKAPPAEDNKALSQEELDKLFENN